MGSTVSSEYSVRPRDARQNSREGFGVQPLSGHNSRGSCWLGVGKGLDIPLFDDNPTTTDRLGFSTLTEITVETLTRPNLDPVCVGITGPWGSGKSSIVLQVKAALSGRNDVLVVYVEPWAFDPNTDPKAHLIGDVLNAISAQVQETKGNNEFRDRLKGLLGRVRWARAVRLAATTALTAQLPNIENLADLFGPAESDTVVEPSIDGFRDEFVELMEDEQLKSLSRVVVVVDDLDRCLSDTVIAVLEAIKLFLSVPKMAFLVAADETAVRSAIASRYGAGVGATKLAERYLDKIVQIPVRVPVLDRLSVEAYVLQLLSLGIPADGSAEADKRLRDHCDALRHEPIHKLADRRWPDDIPAGQMELAQRLAPLLHVGLDGNPRRIKRFLNEMSQRERLAQSRGIDVDRAAVAKLMVLEQVHPHEFNHLVAWVRSDELEPRLTAIENDDDAAGALADWCRMSPSVDAAVVRRFVLLAASLKGEVIAVHALPEPLRDMASALTSGSDSRRLHAWRKIRELSVEDVTHLSRYLAETICTQPDSQADLAESLGRLAERHEAAADTIATVISRMPAQKVDPALVIALAPPQGVIVPSIRSTIDTWRASGSLTGQALRAANKALDADRE